MRWVNRLLDWCSIKSEPIFQILSPTSLRIQGTFISQPASCNAPYPEPMTFIYSCKVVVVVVVGVENNPFRYPNFNFR